MRFMSWLHQSCPIADCSVGDFVLFYCRANDVVTARKTAGHQNLDDEEEKDDDHDEDDYDDCVIRVL